LKRILAIIFRILAIILKIMAKILFESLYYCEASEHQRSARIRVLSLSQTKKANYYVGLNII